MTKKDLPVSSFSKTALALQAPKKSLALQVPIKLQSANSLASIKDLRVNYGGKNVLEGINLDFNRGEVIIIIGPNGSGKSTLLKAIAGLLPYKGKVKLADNTRISYLPQNSDFSLDFPVTARDVVAMGTWGLPSTAIKNPVSSFEEAVTETDIKDILDKPISRLSGGQLQRVLLARTLLQQGDLVMLDEPLNAVDVTTQRRFLTVLQKLQSQNKTILLTTHDLEFAKELDCKVLFINRAVVKFGKLSDIDCKEALIRTFGENIIYREGHEHFTIADQHTHAHH